MMYKLNTVQNLTKFSQTHQINHKTDIITYMKIDNFFNSIVHELRCFEVAPTLIWQKEIIINKIIFLFETEL